MSLYEGVGRSTPHFCRSFLCGWRIGEARVSRCIVKVSNRSVRSWTVQRGGFMFPRAPVQECLRRRRITVEMLFGPSNVKNTFNLLKQYSTFTFWIYFLNPPLYLHLNHNKTLLRPLLQYHSSHVESFDVYHSMKYSNSIHIITNIIIITFTRFKYTGSIEIYVGGKP